ncbi:centromere protein K-like [Argonauta hians]
MSDEIKTESSQNKVMQDACLYLWDDILQAHHKGSKKKSTEDESVPVVTEKYLQSAVNIKEEIPDGLPVDNDFQQKYVILKLKKNIQEQKNLLHLMDSMEVTLSSQLDLEKEDNQKLKSITKALTACSSRRAEAGGINENRYLQEIMQNIKLMKEEREWLSNSLIKFTKKYYPKLRQTTLFSVDRSNEQYSLVKMIMTFIDRTLNHSHDTYVTVNSRFTSGYLELLKECRIVECHPNCKDKVRLIPHILP